MVYNGILALLSPAIAVYLLQRYLSGKSRPGWRERWGVLPVALRQPPDCRPRLWVHAVSAGEVVAAVPILKALRACLPDYAILFSVITLAGHEMAAQQAAPFVDAIFYFPFDLPWVARRVVKAIRPQAFVSLESELWPNVLHALKRQGAATIMVNGRISERNFRRARRLGGLFGWVLSHLDRLLMQSEGDAERARALGGQQLAPERVVVLGNSKFDQEIMPLSAAEVRALRAELKLPEEAPIFVAGSTRSAEEESQVLAAYNQMRVRFPDLCLILAPRHIQRAEEVMAAAKAAGLTPVCRTQLAEAGAPARQIILDTIGELAKVYAVAAFAFVGNSFPPVVKGGGQNILQPLAHGKPVLFGPRTATIRSETALAIEAGVGFRVEDEKELATQGIRLLESPAERQAIEACALALIAANRGVSARYAEAVAELAKAAL